MTTLTEQDIIATYTEAIREAVREFTQDGRLAEIAYGHKADAADAVYFRDMDALGVN